jgi:hypothetical protein
MKNYEEYLKAKYPQNETEETGLTKCQGKKGNLGKKKDKTQDLSLLEPTPHPKNLEY